MYTQPNYDWETQNRQVVLEGTRILERTGESVARSNQIAIETEDIGNEVINELAEQRESLLHTRNRLENANEELNNTNSVLKRMSRSVIYNKLILILIIIIEIIIVASLAYIKFFKTK